MLAFMVIMGFVLSTRAFLKGEREKEAIQRKRRRRQRRATWLVVPVIRS
jgi:uncharacterized membrane protein YidH (DUF202 family)